MPIKKNTPIENTENTSNTTQVVLDLNTAKCILELFRNVELADLHFHSCQSVNFRMHLQSVYKAPNISAAFGRLETIIKNLGME